MTKTDGCDHWWVEDTPYATGAMTVFVVEPSGDHQEGSVMVCIECGRREFAARHPQGTLNVESNPKL